MKGNALAAIFFLSVLTLPSADAAFASNTPAYPEPRTLEESPSGLQKYAQEQGHPEPRPAEIPSETARGRMIQGAEENKPNYITTPCLTDGSSSKCQGIPESRPPEKKKGNSTKKHSTLGDS
jgi:hypothetical protein